MSWLNSVIGGVGTDAVDFEVDLVAEFAHEVDGVV